MCLFFAKASLTLQLPFASPVIIRNLFGRLRRWLNSTTWIISYSTCNWSNAFFNLRLSSSTLASPLWKGGAVALSLGGAFLRICCGFSFSDDLQPPLHVGDLLLPQTSLHLGTHLTRASSVVQYPLMFTSPFATCCFLSSIRFALAKSFILLSTKNLCCMFHCLAFVLARSCLQLLLYHDAIHIIEFVSGDLHQECSGSLTAASCQYGCVSQATCTHVSTDPAL